MGSWKLAFLDENNKTTIRRTMNGHSLNEAIADFVELAKSLGIITNSLSLRID